MTREPALRRAWDALAADLGGDREAVGRFVAAWTGALGPRLLRLRAALTAGDVGDAEAVLLSLRCTSTMVGAHELAALAGRELAVVRGSGGEGDPRSPDRRLADLTTAAVVAVTRTAAVLPAWCDGEAPASVTPGSAARVSRARRGGSPPRARC
ncbi:hypothetical protein [Cellulosimicrobium sp. CUA-896]|uniref:hypothetical protein n=1 Tax=Cellulosimicrobium sp. CUA-896 TaxID=1517881 RepID=UPI000965DCB5|nr:hypothetical protein [Cellulosimicrobium sp. CUA-896]OLT53035.1 hypothetical protein BJF88_01105 [Cellulosimicrobium sp. CUA-896]